MNHGAEGQVFDSALEQARTRNLLSEEHFSVDKTLLEAWASQKSFQPKDPEDREGDGPDSWGQERSNDTHASATDPDARLHKKSAGEVSRLSYLGHIPMDNRYGLITGQMVTTANGDAEMDAVALMVDDSAVPSASPLASTRAMIAVTSSSIAGEERQPPMWHTTQGGLGVAWMGMACSAFKNLLKIRPKRVGEAPAYGARRRISRL